MTDMLKTGAEIGLAIQCRLNGILYLLRIGCFQDYGVNITLNQLIDNPDFLVHRIDNDMRFLIFGTDFLDYVKAIHPGQLNVEDINIESSCFQQSDEFLTSKNRLYAPYLRHIVQYTFKPFQYQTMVVNYCYLRFLIHHNFILQYT